jgi:hypothetical protein
VCTAERGRTTVRPNTASRINGERAEAGRGVGAFLLGELGDTGGVTEPTVRDSVLLYADPGRALLCSRCGEAEEAVAGRAAAFAAAVREVGWAEEARWEMVVCAVVGWALSEGPAPPGRPPAEAGRVRIERDDFGESMFALSCRLSRFESVADRACPLRALISANTCTSPTCTRSGRSTAERGSTHSEPANDIHALLESTVRRY